jgi:prophage maintenance system killer protein
VVFAAINGMECIATVEELVAITLAVARGDVQAEALAIWFRQRLRDAAS